MGSLWLFRKGGAGRCHISILTAAEAESFLGTFFLLFMGQFWNFNCVYVHGVEVFDSGGRGEGLEGLGGLSTTLGNLVSAVPLVLEMSSFGVPLVDFAWNGVKGHDLFHKWYRDPSSKEADEYIVICNVDAGNVALEG